MGRRRGRDASSEYSISLHCADASPSTHAARHKPTALFPALFEVTPIIYLYLAWSIFRVHGQVKTLASLLRSEEWEPDAGRAPFA